MPSPPVWYTGNDGLFDTRILHSADGATNWKYINGDRGAFFARGPQGGDLNDNPNEVPAATDPRTWRESMTAAVRGLSVRGNETMHFYV